ncbi:MAG: hypothetical protein ABSB90_03375 [Thermoplasmata archaeon]
MTERARAITLGSLLTLRRTRAEVRGVRAKLAVTAIAVGYGFVALLAGYMLEFVRTGASTPTVAVLTNPYSPAWWNYPALIVVTPGAVLVLPLLATISMAVVSIGVGLGMGAGLLVAIRFFRSWRAARTMEGQVPLLAGMTPAMVALLTLGACCSTSAAAAGALGAVASITGEPEPEPGSIPSPRSGAFGGEPRQSRFGLAPEPRCREGTSGAGVSRWTTHPAGAAVGRAGPASTGWRVPRQ